MMSTKKLVITYPPDFDGELWIHTKQSKVHSIDLLSVSFETVCENGESEADVLVRVAKDILRQFEKKD